MSERTFERLEALYELEARGRGRGEMATWLLRGRRADVPAGAFPAPKEPVMALPGALGRRWRAGGMA